MESTYLFPYLLWTKGEQGYPEYGYDRENIPSRFGIIITCDHMILCRQDSLGCIVFMSIDPE